MWINIPMSVIRLGCKDLGIKGIIKFTLFEIYLSRADTSPDLYLCFFSCARPAGVMKF